MCSGVAFDVLTRVGVLVADAPGLGEAHHFREDAERTVRLVGNVRISTMEISDIGRGNAAGALGAEERVDEEFDGALVFALGPRLAADGNVLLEETGSEFLNGKGLPFQIPGRCRVAIGAADVAEEAQRGPCGRFRL